MDKIKKYTIGEFCLIIWDNTNTSFSYGLLRYSESTGIVLNYAFLENNYLVYDFRRMKIIEYIHSNLAKIKK